MVRYFPSQQELLDPAKLERVLRDAYTRIYAMETKTKPMGTKAPEAPAVLTPAILAQLNAAGAFPLPKGDGVVPTILEGSRENMPVPSIYKNGLLYHEISSTEFPSATFDIYWYIQGGLWEYFPWFGAGVMADTYANRPDPSHTTGVLLKYVDDGLPFNATDLGTVVWLYDYDNERWDYSYGVWSATLANRPVPAMFTAGDDDLLFNATDRGTITWAYNHLGVGLGEWIYTSGVHSDTYANRPLVAAMLAGDNGYLFYATDWTVTWAYNHASTRWDYTSGTYTNTFANRPTVVSLGAGDNGLPFYASDWTVTWEFNFAASRWDYVSGTYYNTLTNLPAGLGAGDAGLRFFATDYLYTYVWDGAAWVQEPPITYYFGHPTTDGTWRIVRNGTDLDISRREGGNYVIKATVIA